MILRRIVAVGIVAAAAASGAAGCKSGGSGSIQAPPRSEWPAYLKKKLAEHKAAGKTPAKKTVNKVGAATQVAYSIDAGLASIEYPNSANLPAPYASFYQGVDVLASVKLYTQQSVVRDGYTDAVVTVSSGDPNYVDISITASDPTIVNYPDMHIAFTWAVTEALLGSALCMQCTDCASCPTLCQAGNKTCWDPKPDANNPWWPFLPLGLPLLNQKTVLFLDYPPNAALTGKDYLQNFTMCRWGRVMGGAGAGSPFQYETIVDSRPIAAPGTGEDVLLPVPMTTYNDQSMTTGSYYLTPMMGILSNPLAVLPSATLPIAVFGTPARQTWGQIIGKPTPSPGTVGSTNLGGQSQTTAWIATNHPDVTTYQTCTSNPTLPQSEQLDLVASCWMISMGANPSQDPNLALTACQSQWSPPASDASKLAACIQEKTDDNNKASVCCHWADAWSYCTEHNNDACATPDCNVSAATKAKAPPPPPWWQDCNPMRGFCGGR